MFTSRAEFRILLRQDNADQRLTPVGHEIGLAGSDRMTRLQKKRSAIQHIHHFLNKHNVEPEEANPFLTASGTTPLQRKTRYAQLVLRPQVSLLRMLNELPSLEELFRNDMMADLPGENEVIQAAEIELKYKGYLDKERELADKINRLENVKLGPTVDYQQVPGLSNEAREKLNAVKPGTVGQASRISGINPSDISVLLVYMGR